MATAEHAAPLRNSAAIGPFTAMIRISMSLAALEAIATPCHQALALRIIARPLLTPYLARSEVRRRAPRHPQTRRELQRRVLQLARG